MDSMRIADVNDDTIVDEDLLPAVKMIQHPRRRGIPDQQGRIDLVTRQQIEEHSRPQQLERRVVFQRELFAIQFSAAINVRRKPLRYHVAAEIVVIENALCVIGF